MTLQEFWSSLTINTKDKIKNPFFGSLALVWVFYHHSELYRLLFCYQDHQKQMSDLNLLFAVDENLILIIIKTLGVMVFSYFVLALTNLFVMSYSNRTIPWLLGISSKGTKVVEKSKYDRLVDEYSSINSKHNQLIEERNEAVSTRITLQQARDSARLEARDATLKQQSADNEKSIMETHMSELQANASGFEQALIRERGINEGLNNSLTSANLELQKQIKVNKDQLKEIYLAHVSHIKLFRDEYMASTPEHNQIVHDLKQINSQSDSGGFKEVLDDPLYKYGFVIMHDEGRLELSTLGKALLRFSQDEKI